VQNTTQGEGYARSSGHRVCLPFNRILCHSAGSEFAFEAAGQAPRSDAYGSAHARFEGEDEARRKREQARLYLEVSNPGESMDSFAARISALAVTEERRVSICGVIGEASGRYSIALRADNTWKRCEIDLKDTVDAHTSTGVTFHTHTSDADSVRGFSAQEFKRSRGHIAFGKVVRYQDGRTKDRPITTR
jgi:hypothetical protein